MGSPQMPQGGSSRAMVLRWRSRMAVLRVAMALVRCVVVWVAGGYTRRMSGDDALKVAAATWIVLMAIVAATISWVLCAAVVGGAGVALIERKLSRQA